MRMGRRERIETKKISLLDTISPMPDRSRNGEQIFYYERCISKSTQMARGRVREFLDEILAY